MSPPLADRAGQPHQLKQELPRLFLGDAYLLDLAAAIEVDDYAAIARSFGADSLPR